MRVGVVDPLPMFTSGIMATLDDVASEAPGQDDVLDWARHGDRRVLLLTLHAAGDWELLAQLGALGSNLTVVAVLEQAGVDDYVRALSTGATGAMPRSASGREVRAVVQAAVDGRALLPVEVIQALARREVPPEPDSGQPSRREVGWLQALASGVSVGRLADQSGYSERMMFRLLRDLYSKLGAANRTEALILATDRGWL